MLKKFLDEHIIKFPVLIILLVTVWSTMALLTYTLHHYYERSGTLGDSFGVVNSLFTALAFAGTLYTIRQQNKAIEQERQDRKEAIEFQAKQIEDDRNQRMLERVEVTFLNLLGVHKTYLYSKNELPPKANTVYEAILEIVRKLSDLGKKNNKGEFYLEEVYTPFELFINSYINSLDLSLVYLSKQSITENDRKIFLTIALSHLTREERLVLKVHISLFTPYESSKNRFNRVKELVEIKDIELL